jgi:glycosyltransferase involved in cell wall biosynthesis
MISATMIVKNEESCLDKCLESIKGVDEIIICDTGSTDNTIEIAKRYTDKVFDDYKWNDSFCEARNHSLSKASGDWILIVDADEELEEGGVDKLKKAIAEAEEKGYKAINFIAQSKTGKETFRTIRAFKNNEGIIWQGAIHNYLSITEALETDITFHYGYSEAHKKDPDRALRILKNEVERDNTLIREKYYLAREYWYRKDYDTAIYWYKKYLETAFWSPEMADAYLMIAKCIWAKGDHSLARDYCLQAIKINADFKEALLLMAELSGPNNKLKWLEYAEHANNKNVLFIR